MLADNVRGCPKNEYLAGSFEGKYEILRTICQPRTLSANIPASQKGVSLFYNLPINFHIVQKTAREKPVLNVMAMIRIFVCTVQSLSRKKACWSQKKNQIILILARVENQKQGAFSLKAGLYGTICRPVLSGR